MTSHLSDLVIARWVAKGIAKGEEGSAASGRERARWGAHLEACDDCAERAAAALLAADAPECAADKCAAATGAAAKIDVQSYVERIRPELAPSAPAPVLRVLGRRPLRWALSAAACLVLAAGWMLLQRDFPLDPYGNSENGENGRNSENGKDGAGAAALPVKPPRIVQDLSNTGPRPALWTAADGSKVWRQPGAKLHLLESKDGRVSLSLESGQVDVEVVPQPAPFVIESKGAQIRVLGTRFTAHAFSLRGGGAGAGRDPVRSAPDPGPGGAGVEGAGLAPVRRGRGGGVRRGSRSGGRSVPRAGVGRGSPFVGSSSGPSGAGRVRVPAGARGSRPLEPRTGPGVGRTARRHRRTGPPAACRLRPARTGRRSGPCPPPSGVGLG